MVAWKGTGKGECMVKYKRISTVDIKTIINASIEVRDDNNKHTVEGTHAVKPLLRSLPCLGSSKNQKH